MPEMQEHRLARLPQRRPSQGEEAHELMRLDDIEQLLVTYAICTNIYIYIYFPINISTSLMSAIS